MEVGSSKEITIEDLALFKDALTGEGCDNIEVKVYTARRIASLAKALGPQRTREELLDILSTQLDNLDDEVLFSLSEELELFLPLVGGPEYSYKLLTVLLRISRSVDETLVRNRAVEAIKKLLGDIDQQLTEKYLVSSIVEVDDNVWFSEKCSTLSLIPVCYPKASAENKILLRQKYCQIFDDNSALVRKLAAVGLPDFINVLEVEHVLKDFVPMLDQIEKDDQDSVKINAIDVGISIANKSKNQEVRNDMLEIIRKLSRNESWRIRQRVALCFDQIAQTFGNEEFVHTLLEIYENLINDSETEVRVYAVQHIYNFCRNLSENFNRMENEQKFEDIFLERYMPIILSITSDSSDEVQIAFSSAILSLSTVISNECFKDTILPIVISGLEEDKPLHFKENILSNLDYLPKDIDLVKYLSSINKIIQHILLTSETSWRARRSLLITFVHVSKFCSEEFFEKNMLVYYIILLKDNIFAVRRTATLILPILAKQFGGKWLVNQIMPHIHMTLKDDKYLFRYIILFCIQELIYPSIDSDIKFNSDEKYLGDFKKLMEKNEKKYTKTLCKISRMNLKLRQCLKEKPFDNIINTYVDHNNIEGENVRIYSEDLLDTIIKNSVDLFSIKDSGMCYLEAVLILLNKEILNVLRILIKDPIINIQDRAKYIITKIKHFSDDLNEEISRSWVETYTTGIEDSTWEEIDAEIAQQLKDIEENFVGAEKIDTYLMETIENEHSLRHSVEVLEIAEKLEVFPSDSLKPEDMHIDEMESVDEEKMKDSKS